MSNREPLSGPDNAWRRMGKIDNLMTITGILTFEEEVTYEEFCERLEERLLRFERFKQRIGGRKRRIRQPYWETVEDFNVEDHVYQIDLPEPQDKETFEQFISTLMSRPLDERRPLWEAYHLESAGQGDGNAVAVRLDHSIGDGFALLYVMLGLVDNPREIEFPIGGVSKPPEPPDSDDPDEEPSDNIDAESSQSDIEEKLEPESGGADDDDGVEDLREKATSSGPLGTLGTGLKAAKTGIDLLTMPDETETSLYGDLGPTKRAGWTNEIDLDKVKEIGEAHDATVNDVMLASVAGAIRRLFESREEDITDLELRFTVPVNLKPMEARDGSLGNYFGLVFVPVPVGSHDLEERIEIIHERMDVRKAGIEAYLLYQLLNLGGHLPDAGQEFMMSLFEKQATGIVTNVPGPVDPVEFAGTEIRDIIFWVPQANDQGLGVSIISYNDAIRVGVSADANLLPDASELTDAFETEIQQLFEDLEA